MTRPDPMPHLAAVLAAHRAAEQPRATFQAIDEALAACIGHRLFTILINHPSLREAERYYSNMPDAYPVGGRKPMVETPLMRQLMVDGVPYIGPTREDIARNFPDHELIFSLGCESVLNVPVFWDGQAVASMNLLHRSGWYDDADIPVARLFAHLALPAILLLSRV
jgi:hypothetical protein